MNRALSADVVAGSEMLEWREDPQNCIQRAVVMLALWRLSLSNTVFFRIYPENKSLLAISLPNVEEKSLSGMLLVRDDVYWPASKAH